MRQTHRYRSETGRTAELELPVDYAPPPSITWVGPFANRETLRLVQAPITVEQIRARIATIEQGVASHPSSDRALNDGFRLLRDVLRAVADPDIAVAEAKSLARTALGPMIDPECDFWGRG